MPFPTIPAFVYHKTAWLYFKRITDLDRRYDVISLFNAVPVDATSGKFKFTPATNMATLKADIKTCQARGQKILVTVGGANATVPVFNQAQADNFVQSAKELVTGLGGIDGLDINVFEGVQDARLVTWLPYACKKIRALYGDQFVFTSPVSATHWQDQATFDRRLMLAMHNEGLIRWFAPQYYDGPGLPVVSQVVKMTQFYSEIGIPATKIGIGFGIAGRGFPASGNKLNWWLPEDVPKALAAVPAAGAFNYATDLDQDDTFARSMTAAFPPETVRTYAEGFEDGSKAGEKRTLDDLQVFINDRR